MLRSTYQHKIIPFSKSSFIPDGQNVKELDKLPVSILQPEGPLFFGSIEPLMKSYATIYKHEILIVDLNQVTMIDLSGVYALEDIIKSEMAKNIEVFVLNASPDIKKILEKLDFIEHIGKGHYKDSNSSVFSIILERYHIEKLNFINE